MEQLDKEIWGSYVIPPTLKVVVAHRGTGLSKEDPVDPLAGTLICSGAILDERDWTMIRKGLTKAQTVSLVRLLYASQVSYTMAGMILWLFDDPRWIKNQ